jgi:hypothetical protein
VTVGTAERAGERLPIVADVDLLEDLATFPHPKHRCPAASATQSAPSASTTRPAPLITLW